MIYSIRKLLVRCPKNYHDIENFSDAAEWYACHHAEIAGLEAKQAWEVVPCPPGIQPITCHFVYCRKYNADGTIAKYKARLVADGNRQKPGTDYV